MKGRIAILDWLQSHGVSVWQPAVAAAAAAFGQLTVCKYTLARSVGVRWDRCCGSACMTGPTADGGHVDCKCIREQFAKDQCRICAISSGAALSGYTNILNLLHAERVFLHGDIVMCTMHNLHIHVLEWLIEKGLTDDNEMLATKILDNALLHDDLEEASWAREKGASRPEQHGAADFAKYWHADSCPTLQWAVTAGLPWGDWQMDRCQDLLSQGAAAVVECARINGSPCGCPRL